jgi:hypothetical protein
MRRLLLQSLSVIAVAVCLTAAEQVWRSKPAAEWTVEDARQVLSSSPWTKVNKAVVTRRLSEDELREAGQMGQPQGIGYDNVDPKGSGPKVSPNIFTGPGGADRSARSRPQPIMLRMRWESALPVRLAELKTNEAELPTLEGDGYKISVFGLPSGDFKGDPKQLGEPLKSQAALKRDGKKDVKPLRVEVFQSERGVVVVYLFPLSAEISRQDGQVRFDAQIGRIVVDQPFVLSEMEFMGKLEL